MSSAAPPEAAFKTFSHHGGDLQAAARLFPDAPRPWIDLSTGINPHSYPLPEIPPEAWTRLPGLDALAGLEATAARRYRAPPRARVVAGPGSQALVQALARILPARSVGVLSPTYQGHARAWGARAEAATTLAALADHDVAIVVNPNNPDGRVISAADLRELAARRLVIVDEAFADFDAAGESLAPELPERGAIVLRSFGKTYGLGGVRLGFAISVAELADPLRAALGPWAVSGPAIEIGTRALGDDAWLAAMGARLGAETRRLDRMLAASGFEVLGGTRLFRLAAHERAPARFRSLCRAGILARPFVDAPDWLRFGLPAEEAACARLAAALSP